MKVDKASLMSDCFNEASHTARMWLMPLLPLGLISTVAREALKGECGAGLVLSVTLAAHTHMHTHQVSPQQTQEVTFSCQIPVTQQHGLFHTPIFPHR